MAESTSPESPERQLLFGLLAHRAGLIDRAQLSAAWAAWSSQKSVPLAEVLRGRGWLSSESVDRIEQEARRELQARHGDVADVVRTLVAEVQEFLTTLQSLAAPPSLVEALATRSLPVAVPAGELSTRIEAIEPLTKPPVGESSFSGYTVLGLHASGGLGRVWKALDPELGREVALKELRPEVAQDPTAATRFLEEARITGQLEHPGIVPVYALARPSRGGQPFYSMRFIQGRTLSEAIRAYHVRRSAGSAGPLDLAVLLGAFVGICNAVAFAHARGILHRDLKGANVVLGDFGEVIVLDWGLAKRLHQPESAGASTAPESEPGHTLQGQVLGTPGYMAPEQAEGRLDLIDERTDVYGLGAVLYEALTGGPPFRGASLRDVLNKVRTEPPPPPRQVWSGVPRALEAICLKALAKRREERYSAAVELAREVQRWLADEPVQAYREPLPARVARWGRRHKTAVAGLVSLLGTAAVALSITTVLVSREHARTLEAQHRAEANFARAREAVDRYFVQVSTERLLNEPGLQPLRKELLETARSFYQEMQKEAQDNRAVQADLGHTYLQLGRITAEIDPGPQAASYLREAIARFEELAAADSLALKLRDQQATAHNSLGLLERAAGRLDAATAEFQQVLTLRKELAAAAPEVPAYRSELALGYNHLGVVQRDVGHLAEAEAAYREALPLQRQLVREHPETALYQSDLAGTWTNLGIVYTDGRRWAEAEAALQEALTLREQLTRDHPLVVEYQNHRASSYNNFGTLYQKTSRSRQAGEAYRQALAIRTQVAQANPAVTQYQAALANVHHNMGTWLHAEGQLPEATAAYQQGLAIWERLQKEHAQVEEFAVGVGWSSYHLGWVLADRGQFPESLTWYDRAVRTLAALPHPERPNVAPILRNTYWGRAEVLGKLDRHKEALADWDRALEGNRSANHEEMRLGRALALARAGEHARADEEVAALATTPRISPDTLYRLAGIEAQAAGHAGDKGPAERYAMRAVALLEQARASGYFKSPAARQRLKMDPHLEPLRQRTDFRSFLHQLEESEGAMGTPTHDLGGYEGGTVQNG